MEAPVPGETVALSRVSEYMGGISGKTDASTADSDEEVLYHPLIYKVNNPHRSFHCKTLRNAAKALPLS